MFRLVVAVRSHLPVGSPDDARDALVRDEIEPLLGRLERRQGLRLAWHLSGCLLQLLEGIPGAIAERLGRLAREGRLELLGGGFYEPLLPMIPEADLAGQIEYLARELERIGARRPRGAWLTAQAWEPSLARPLAEAGVAWLPVTEELLRAGGWRPAGAGNRLLASADGRSVALFPVDARLGGLLTAGEVEAVIAELRRRAAADPSGVATVAFGEPESGFPSLDRLGAFLDRLDADGGTIATATFEEIVDSTAPAGIVTPPAFIRQEDSLRALPADVVDELRERLAQLRAGGEGDPLLPFVRGGSWRGILEARPATRHRLARMRDLSGRVRSFERGGEIPSDREALWRAQCHDAWWREEATATPRLRRAISAAMLRAEHRLDRAAGQTATGSQLRIVDFDGDGRPEACASNGRLSLWLRSDGGGVIEEIGDRLRLFDWADARGVDATFPASPAIPEARPLRARLVRAPGPSDGIGEVRGDDPILLASGRVAFEAGGNEELRIVSTPPDGAWRLVRTLRLRSERIEFSVTLESESEIPEGTMLVIDWPIALPGDESEIRCGEERRIAAGETRTLAATRELEARIPASGAAIRFGFARAVRVTHRPIRGAPGGDAGAHEGSLVTFGVPAAGGRAGFEFTVDFA